MISVLEKREQRNIDQLADIVKWLGSYLASQVDEIKEIEREKDYLETERFLRDMLSLLNTQYAITIKNCVAAIATRRFICDLEARGCDGCVS